MAATAYASARPMSDAEYGDRSVEGVRRRLAALSRFLDSAVRVPGTNFRVGADAAMAVVPGIGSLAASAVSAYLVLEAARLGVRRRDLVRMGGNIVIDTALGSIPLVGVLFDAVFKANNRNMRILNEHLDRTHRTIDLEPAAGGRR